MVELWPFTLTMETLISDCLLDSQIVLKVTNDHLFCFSLMQPQHYRCSYSSMQRLFVCFYILDAQRKWRRTLIKVKLLLPSIGCTNVFKSDVNTTTAHVSYSNWSSNIRVIVIYMCGLPQNWNWIMSMQIHVNRTVSTSFITPWMYDAKRELHRTWTCRLRTS